MRGLSAKTAIVFGGSSGIGRAIAVRLARERVRVAVAFSPGADKGRELVDQTADQIRAEGAEVLIVETEITDPAQIERAFDQVDKTFGGIDFAINSAGVISYGPVAGTTEAEFDSVFAINSKGAFFFLKAAAARVKDGGRILAFTSPASRIGHANGAIYGGSKAAVETFVRALAWELAPRGITVNSIAPGTTNTPMLLDAFREAGAAMSPFNRLGSPEDVGDAACMLLSEDARWVTGTILYAGGGSTML